MASQILKAIAVWLAEHTLDEIIDSTSGPDVTAAESRQGILHFIEKKDELDSQRMMWGLLYTYNQIFRETNVLFYFQSRIGGLTKMGDLVKDFGEFPNLHYFWEMIVGKKIFTSQLKEYHPDVHPEVRALLKTQMILLMEYVGFSRETAVKTLETHWKQELRMESNYYYGHYWETRCRFAFPCKVSMVFPFRYGRMWDGAEGKWYARIREIYKDEILAKAERKALDPRPRDLDWYVIPPGKCEEHRIDANSDWFNEDGKRSADQLWENLATNIAEPPAYIKGYDTRISRYIPGIKIPLYPK